MAPYWIRYLGSEGQVVSSERQWFRDDDHAIDTIGESDHPHEIEIHQDGRLVARFPRLGRQGLPH